MFSTLRQNLRLIFDMSYRLVILETISTRFIYHAYRFDYKQEAIFEVLFYLTLPRAAYSCHLLWKERRNPLLHMHPFRMHFTS